MPLRRERLLDLAACRKRLPIERSTDLMEKSTVDGSEVDEAAAEITAAEGMHPES